MTQTRHKSLEGRTAIITGAARGIGLSAVERFLAEGCNVLAFDLPGSDFSDAQKLGESAKLGLSCFEGDVTRPDDWQTALAQAVHAFGSVEILFNNAGISGPIRGPLDIDIDDFDKVIAVNVRGVFLGIQTVGQHMKEQKKGVIINVSSISGIRGGGRVFAYTTSKHAVNGMTRSAAINLVADGVRVCAVCPSPTGTEMMFALERRISPDDPESAREGLSAGNPMQRYAEPEEIVNAVAFLASDEASFMTGTLIDVDGGLLAR